MIKKKEVEKIKKAIEDIAKVFDAVSFAARKLKDSVKEDADLVDIMNRFEKLIDNLQNKLDTLGEDNGNN